MTQIPAPVDLDLDVVRRILKEIAESPDLGKDCVDLETTALIEDVLASRASVQAGADVSSANAAASNISAATSGDNPTPTTRATPPGSAPSPDATTAETKNAVSDDSSDRGRNYNSTSSLLLRLGHVDTPGQQALDKQLRTCI